jgi:hypothetical protein
LRATGYSQEQINEVAVAKNEAALDGSPDNPDPPVEVKLPPEFGEDKDRPLSPTEAAEKLTSWREQQEQQRLSELAALVGQEQAQAEQQAQPQPEPQQPQPQQPQPTPEQTERAALAAERQRLASLKRSEGAEVVERIAYDQLRAQVVAEFPSLRNAMPHPAEIEDLRVRDPARFQRLAQFDQALRERQARISSLAQQRAQNEQRQAAQEAAQLERWAQAQNAIIDAELPELRDPRTAAAFKQDVAETLKAMNITQEHLSHHIFGPALRSVEGQRLLADATRWRVATAKANQARQINLPPVMKPGTYRAPDSGQSVRDLQMQLKGAKGRDALRIATEITRARRMNGGL